ncbi:MAG TPA: hypothetical protein VET26_09115, partial [Candidatus Sulfotelmatobacter sp.]|nr:hypothetical protein [Candidatus Sulfotelmatobacter sp.]
KELADLFARIWGRDEEAAIGSDVLKALAHSGNYVAGAPVEGGELIGGLVGWFGGVPPRHLHMHSHILGVTAGRDAKGLGFELKQHQRRWCLERGVDVMEWTTDPLVRRNVYFNLGKLGARAPEYLVNFYGQMDDGINAGEESDRLLIRWDLASPRAERAAAGHRQAPGEDWLIGRGAVPILRVGASSEPIAAASTDARELLCELPEDIVEMRRTDPALARRWRLAVRSALTAALAEGFHITGATRSGWYVLGPQAE